MKAYSGFRNRDGLPQKAVFSGRFGNGKGACPGLKCVLACEDFLWQSNRLDVEAQFSDGN